MFKPSSYASGVPFPTPGKQQLLEQQQQSAYKQLLEQQRLEEQQLITISNNLLQHQLQKPQELSHEQLLNNLQGKPAFYDSKRDLFYDGYNLYKKEDLLPKGILFSFKKLIDYY